MKKNRHKRKFINYDEELEQLEDENTRLNKINNSSLSYKKKKDNKYNFLYILSILLILICIFFILIYMKIYLDEYQKISDIKNKFQTNSNISKIFNETKNNNNINNSNINNNNNNSSLILEIEPPDKNIKFNESNETNENEYQSEIIQREITKKKFILPNNKNNGKIGIAFVFKSLYGNGIGRMLSVTCSELAKLEKYDIYMITGAAIPSLDFPFDKRVIMVRIAGNRTLIQKYDETSNIKIYVLQNALNPSSIKFYKNLNGGKKVIGVMHGVYISSIFANLTGVYTIWKYNQLFDAYIQVIADDYYINKKLGINNSFFFHNLYTFDADKTLNSNLTYNNLIIMGRQLDKIKGGLYGIKAMDIIRREIPDAKLYFVSSNYKITFLDNLIKELNLTENIEVLHFTKDISKLFLNSSIFINPSLSEACPMVISEAKAFGLPIIGFNVSYSLPYQEGVIKCDIANYTQIAEEAIKLLKDYNYRKQKGIEAKESLKRFSNKDIVDKWCKLFEVLVNNDMEGYKNLQKSTFDKKYYEDESAREHLEYSWKRGQMFNRYFCCHDFNDMLNITYINNIKGCKNQSLCK